MAAAIPRASDLAARLTANRRLLAVYGIFAAVVLLYWPAFALLGEVWSDGERTTYTHGYLVAAVSLWLVWNSRERMIADDGGPDTVKLFLATIALLGAAAGWQIAYRAGLQIVVEFLVLPLLWLPILLMVGRNAARATFLPVAFLSFALPFWDVLTPLLQSASVQAVKFILMMVGTPAFIHGSTVEIPAGLFEIEGGCSGLHFFVVALAISVLIGELRRETWWRRLMWLVLGAALAVLVNWLRISSIIVVGHLTQMQNYLVRESHYGYGWFLFALALLVLFLIERRVSLPTRPQSRPRRQAEGVARAHALFPWSVISAVIIALPMVLNGLVVATPAVAPGIDSNDRINAGWHETPAEASEWQPVQVSADAEWRRRYVRDGFAIETYVASYQDMKPGKKLGGFANRPHGASAVVESGKLQSDSRYAYKVIERDGRKSVIVLTYRVGGRGFANATQAQLWYGWRTLRTLDSPRSEVAAWRMECGHDCDHARGKLEQFLGLTDNHS